MLDVTPPTSDDDEDAYEKFAAAEVAAVGKLFARREYVLTAAQAFAGPPIPDWWQTAIHYANYLEKALLNVPNLIKREQGSLEYALKKVEEAQSKDPNELKKAKAYVAICESKIAKLHQLQPAFVEFAAEVSNFSKGRDPWALMNPDEMAHLGFTLGPQSGIRRIPLQSGEVSDRLSQERDVQGAPCSRYARICGFPRPRPRPDQPKARAATPVVVHGRPLCQAPAGSSYDSACQMPRNGD